MTLSPFEWLTGYLDEAGSMSIGGMYQCPSHSDSYPSLSVTESAESSVLIHCFGGCPAEEVMECLDLSMKNLFCAHPWPPARVLRGSGAAPEFADFEWREGKSARQYDPRMRGHWPSKVSTVLHPYGVKNQLVRARYSDGSKMLYWQQYEHGRWVPSQGLDKSTLPLYKQNKLSLAIDCGHTILLCESESSVDALWQSGYAATTWAGGASSPNVERLRAKLAPANVVFLPDNDRAGMRCLAKLQLKLAPHVLTWSVVQGAEGEDARDLLVRGALLAFKAVSA